MADNPKDYISVPIASMKDCFRNVPCDVYIEISTGYFVKSFDKRTGVDFQRLANYEAKGVEYLYVKKEDLNNFELFLSRSPMIVLTSPDFKAEQKKEAFISAIEQSICEIFEKVQIPDPVSNKVIETVHNAIKNELNFPLLLKSLVELSGKREDHYRHAISTCVHSYLLLNKLGMMSDRTIKIILFASLFHDVGKLTFSKDKRCESDYQTIEELHQFQKHPFLSANMVSEKVNFGSEEIRTCILEHKERADGEGYPNKLKNLQIFELSKILAVAETYSEMTMGLMDGKAYSPMQALSVMKSDHGQFDQKIFLPFYELLNITFNPKKRAA